MAESLYGDAGARADEGRDLLRRHLAGVGLLEEYVDSMLAEGEPSMPLDPEYLPEELRALAEKLLRLGTLAEQARAEKRRLARSALTDFLTGIGNRSAFIQEADRLWAAGEGFTIACVDIDRLKEINDGCGHAEGDRCIRMVARAVRDALLDGETIFRVGGDEFALLSPTADEEGLGLRLEDARDALMATGVAADGRARFSFSYGCSLVSPSLGNKRRQLSVYADRRMYAYKLAHRTGGEAPRKAVETAARLCDNRVLETFAVCLEGRYLFLHDLSSDTSYWPGNAVHDLGLPDAVVEHTVSVLAERAHPEDHLACATELEKLFSGRGRAHTTQFRMLGSDGRYVMCGCKGYRLEGFDGNPDLFAGLLTNYGVVEMADSASGLPDVRALIKRIDRCRLLGVPLGLVMVEIDSFESYNAVYGYAAGDRILAETGARLLSLARGEAAVYRYRGARFCLVARGADKEATERLAADVEKRLSSPIQLKDRLVKIDALVASRHFEQVTANTYTVINDLRRSVRADERRPSVPVRAAVPEAPADPDARRDRLTGLWRGSEFLRRANLFRANQLPESCCLVKFDIGHMHIFNEWHGEDAGNALLAAVGSTLAHVEESRAGVAGFWGQDDFALLMANEWTLIDEVALKVRSVVASFDDSVGFTPSVGIYPLNEGEEVGIDQYSKAAFACSAAKLDFETHTKLFQPIEYERERNEHLMLSKFQYALADNRILFYVQPQVDIRTGAVVGAEALARWRHKDGSVTSPAEFIPALEKSGFISMLDKCVWRSLFERLRAWIDAGGRTVPVSVNVSRVDVAAFDVAGYLDGLVACYRIPRCLVRVEITESAFSDDRKSVGALIERLHHSGFKVHMDDFGTGSSSLGMLGETNVDVIKLDRSFMLANERDGEKGAGIIRGIAEMAAALGIEVIVEGVETAEQEDLMRSCGLYVAQGFRYHRPMPPDDLERLLMSEVVECPVSV